MKLEKNITNVEGCSVPEAVLLISQLPSHQPLPNHYRRARWWQRCCNSEAAAQVGLVFSTLIDLGCFLVFLHACVRRLIEGLWFWSMTILTPASSLSFRRKRERVRYRRTRETLRTRVSDVIRVSRDAFVSRALWLEITRVYNDFDSVCLWRLWQRPVSRN